MLDTLRNHYVNKELVPAFEANGFSLFVVGGPVRDALSGSADFSDLDYTTNARPEDTLRVVSDLGPTWVIGMEFGTVCVQIGDMKVEITTYRTEAYEEGSRKPKVVFGDMIEDDLKRRDLTINAMALCLVSDGRYSPGQVVDLFGGREALTSGVLTTPDDPFRTIDEDPLRSLRAIRFAVRRDMALGAALAEAITSLAGRMSIVAVERRTEELRKVLSVGPVATARAFRLARDLGVASSFMGDVVDLDDVDESTRLLEGLSLDADSLSALSLVFLAGSRAKALSAEDVVSKLEAATKALKFSSVESRHVAQVAGVARHLGTVEPTRAAARRVVRTSSPEVVKDALLVAQALGSSQDLSDLVADVEANEPQVRGPLPVDGNDVMSLGFKGREVGVVLGKVTEAFLVNPSLTRDEALALAG